MGASLDHIETLLAAAAAARNRGCSAQERAALEDAVDVCAADPRALNARGVDSLSRGGALAASTFFAAALAADPREPVLAINLASAFRALADDDGEESSLDYVLHLDRRNFMGQLRMAELQQRRGEIAKAAQSWSNVVQMALAADQPPPAVSAALARGQAFLATHSAAIVEALDKAVGRKRAAMGLAARRFDACVDHSLGRRAIYTNQCSGLHFPFLPADEFFDRSHFPWLAGLEARAEAIAREAMAVLASGGDLIRPYVRMESGGPETKWSGLDGSFDWSACFLFEYGVRNDPVCDLCPETVAALAEVPQTLIPGKAPSAFFSILRPGAHIPPHTGVTNTRTIIHLPLVVPAGCRFRVGGETREWRAGEAFAFDDTIEHEAWNDSGDPRVVLIFDVWNPHLTMEERELLTEFYRVTDELS